MTIQHLIFDNDYFVINRLIDGEYRSFKVSGSQMHDYFDYNPIPDPADIATPVILTPTDGFGVNGNPTTSLIVDYFTPNGIIKFKDTQNFENGSFNEGESVINNIGTANGVIKAIYPNTNRIELEKPYNVTWRPTEYMYMINTSVTDAAVDKNVTFISSEFSPLDSNNSHFKSDWQITSIDDPEFLNPIIEETFKDSSRTQFTPSDGLIGDTEYLVRVKYYTEVEQFEALVELESEWSRPIHIKTST